MIPEAKEPFRFFTRLSLVFLTGLKAKNLPQLLEGIKTAPEAVIYQHTHRYLQQHQHLVPEPANDFAYWVTQMLREDALGEQLAAIDTVQFTSLEDLRRAVVKTIEAYLKKNPAREALEGKEFHFTRAVRFSVPTDYTASTLHEFADALKRVSIFSLYLHVFEARMRPPLGTNDFSYWLENQLGEKALAKKVAALDPYTQTMDGLRNRILTFTEKRLKEAPYAAS